MVAVGVIALVSALPLAWAQEGVEVSWSCPHVTYPRSLGQWSPEPPAQMRVKWLKRGNRWVSEEMELLSAWAAESSIDYQGCLLNLFEASEEAIWSRCYAAQPDSLKPFESRSRLEGIQVEGVSGCVKEAESATRAARAKGLLKGKKLPRWIAGASWKLGAEALVAQFSPAGWEWCRAVAASRAGEPAGLDAAALVSGEFLESGLSQWMAAVEVHKKIGGEAGSLAEQCRRELVSWYVERSEKIESLLKDACAGQESICEGVREQERKNLKKVFQIAGVNLNEKKGDDCCEPDAPSAKKEVEAWDERSKEIKKLSDCAQLKAGETVWSELGPEHAVDGAFRLTRLPGTPVRWEVALPVEFRPKEKDFAMKLRVQKCLDESSRYLKGPKDERIQLKFISPEENHMSYKIDLKPYEPGFRANAVTWIDMTDPEMGKIAEKMRGDPCSTYLHELMHLTGLVDTYSETSRGYWVDPDGKTHGQVDCDEATQVETPPVPSAECRLRYDCRKVGPEHSLMNSHFTAMEHVKAMGGSLLTPAEFRWVTHPGCQALNDNYLECAKLTHMTSKEHGGTGCPASRCTATEGDSSWLFR